jgi:putative spermidine/putrescine transport system permease protein
MPALLGSMILLFGNAFGAYATALSLTGGLINLVTILIGSQIKGDVLHNVNLGYALAFGMVFVMTVTMVGYYLLRRRSERWLKI